MSTIISRTVIALCLLGGLPSAAEAAQGVDTRDLTKYREHVTKLRDRVDKKKGRHAGGLDILKYGIGPINRRRRAKTDEVKEYAAVLERILHPPPPPPVPSVTPASATEGVTVTSQGTGAAAPASGSGGWVIPESIVMCESGGNWNAHNPSGATGPYQLMPEHFAAGGACADLDWSQPGQHSCAARLWAGGAGRSNWAC